MHPAPSCTLFLTERVPHRCRLRPADVAFLIAHHRTHLHVGPTGRRHVYRLTPRGYAGVVVAPGCRLVIRPKITLDNLFFLLDPAAPIPEAPDRTATVPGGEVLDFLAGQFACRLAERAAAGLHRGYREQREGGPYLHGRLDVHAQLREAPGRKEQLHCLFDDFTADLPCNRVLRATAERLLASPLVGDRVRAALRRSLAGLEGVQAIVPQAEEWQRLSTDRLPADYPPLLDLCRLLLDGLAPAEASGPTSAPAFLLDMERVWERHVTRAVMECCDPAGCGVSVQVAHTVGRDDRGRAVVMRPDVTVDRAGRPAVVVDAKWKRPGRGAAADLYQVLAYCTALGAERAVLVYPGRRDRARNYAFEHSRLRVTVRSLRVEGGREACARSARRLGRSLLDGERGASAPCS
jgi:5-methylcytosine-specific restriction enzyme subunit McrC